jgi:hypothetical protein
MNETTTQRTIYFDKFMGRVNGYLFSFMEKSVTGRLTAMNNGFLTVEMRSGGAICAHESTVKSIWHVHQKQNLEMA